MDRIRPKNDFIAPGAPGWGAWEVGVRYSKFDAKDFDTHSAAGGATVDYAYNNSSNDVHSWTAGVKWIPNPNTRFLLDYIDTSFDHDINAGTTSNGVAAKKTDSEKAINFRAQFDF
jgi:phosphate-selective porin OprO/OprP